MGEGVGEGLRICYTLAVTGIRGPLREADGRIHGSCLQHNHPKIGVSDENYSEACF